MSSPVADVLTHWWMGDDTPAHQACLDDTATLLAALSSHGYRIVAVPEGSGIEHGDRLVDVFPTVAVTNNSEDTMGNFSVRTVGGPYYKAVPIDRFIELPAGATYVGEWQDISADKPCPECGGSGVVQVERIHHEKPYRPCQTCKGSGRVPDRGE